MAQRPAPKKSNFGASHPLEHVQATTAAQPVQIDPTSAPSSPTSLPRGPIVGVVESRKKPGPAPQGRVKSKAALFTDEEVIERIRAAWFHTPTMSGERESSFSDFLLEAALVRAQDREKRYNNGEKFPPVRAGKIGAGRKS